MEAYGVRRTAARDEPGIDDFDRRQLALEPQHERIHAFVWGEQVRSEPGDDDVETFTLRMAQRLLELAE